MAEGISSYSSHSIKQFSVFETPSVWDNKEKIFPSCTSRLPLFLKKTKEETPFGYVSISRPLSQTHRDILEAIAVVGERGIRKNTNGQIAYLFNIRDVLKFLGQESGSKNHAWFKSKLKEMATILLEIKNDKLYMVGHILDKFFYTDEYKRQRNPNDRRKFFGNDNMFMVVLSEEFSNLFRQDYIVWTKKETVKAIIDIKYEFVKALVRYCMTHEKVNMNFETILKYMGYEDEDRKTKYKLKKQLIEFADYLSCHFGIYVKEKDGDLFIFYEKNPNIVAIDYQKD